MERTVYQIFQQWQPLLLFGLNLLVLYWFYRIWKKTGETGYFWLMAGLGGAPLAQCVARGLHRLFPTAFSQAPNDFYTMRLILKFIDLSVVCMGLGCVFVGLGLLHNGAIPFRSLFSSEISDSAEEEAS